ncbi:MAG: aldo/keto reductase [Treponema sp.]|nr:aldo/keto reductase [Treponema sp.]
MAEQIFPEIKKNLGFGMMRLPMNNDVVDTEQVSKMVDMFLENGFNYFDTAHGYLNGLSEKAVKICLTSRYDRNKYILTNKLTSPYFNTQKDIRPFFESQLSLCGVDYFDFYLMHAQNAIVYESFKNRKAYETALELKAEGKIKHFGISFHDKPSVLDKILSEYPEIEIVQIQFNYVDYDDASVEGRKNYEICRKHNKPMLIMEPVKGGNLVNLPDACQKEFDDLRKKTNSNASNASYALRFAASFEGIRVVLSGMSDLYQIKDNITSMKNFEPLNEVEMSSVKKVSALFNSQELIACTSCHYCVEENHCPKNILIPDLFACMNKKKIFNDWNQDYYYNNVLTAKNGKASDCIKCGACERVCPQHLKIRNLLDDVAVEFEKTA